MSAVISHPNHLFKKFKDDIITKNSDTKSPDWLTLSHHLEEVVLRPGFEINLISPKSVISDAIDKGIVDEFGGFEKYLDQLENGFYSLSLFALNLCRNPTKRDYKLIKTYTGFYIHNIASVMNGDDVVILQSMGYHVSSAAENQDEFQVRHVSQHIVQLAYQLYLAQIYCRRVKNIVVHITSNNYDDKVAMKLYQHFDKPDFRLEESLELCELTNKQLIREMENSPGYPKQSNEKYEAQGIPSINYTANVQKFDVQNPVNSQIPVNLQMSRMANDPYSYDGYRYSDPRNQYHYYYAECLRNPSAPSLIDDDISEADLYESPQEPARVTPLTAPRLSGDIMIPPSYDSSQRAIQGERSLNYSTSLVRDSLSETKRPNVNSILIPQLYETDTTIGMQSEHFAYYVDDHRQQPSPPYQGGQMRNKRRVSCTDYDACAVNYPGYSIK